MPDRRAGVLEMRGIARRYRQGSGWLQVLQGVDLRIDPGEAVALTGPSGCGKSTLLQIAGLLDRPDGGSLSISGQAADRAGDGLRTVLRCRHVGFVHQYHHLLPELSAEENVAVPQMLAGEAHAAALRRARELLEQVGLGGRATHRPNELSGGEQQRVAICRAVANRPAVLLADEPTGNLDPPTAGAVLDALLELVAAEELAILAATHSRALARRMHRTLALESGRLVPVGSAGVNR